LAQRKLNLASDWQGIFNCTDRDERLYSTRDHSAPQIGLGRMRVGFPIGDGLGIVLVPYSRVYSA
jgi:hypothetical protein